MFLNLVPIFLLPFVTSLLLTPFVRFFALKNKLVVKPKDNRFHKKVTALLGGIGIFIAALIGFFLFVPLTKNILVFLVGATFIFFWGLTDDFKPMQPQLKLLGQIIAGCITILLGISFHFHNQWLSYILTIFWIIGITNAFNLLDNMDGLAAGTAAICGIMIFLTSLMLKNNGIGLIALILASAALGFLPYNFNPAKIYMGDSGSMFLGFSLATVSIMGSFRNVPNIIITLAIPFLILAVPIFDTLFVMVVRNIGGRSIWKGGRDHTSHRLVSLGLSERKTVLLLYCLSILFGLIALLYTKIDIVIVSVFAVLTIVILFFLGMFLSEVKIYEREDEFESAKRKKIARGNVVLNTVILYKRNFIEVFIDLLLICVAYYSSYLLKHDGKIPEASFILISKSLPLIIVIRLIAFFSFGLYSRVWPYISISDIIAIFKAVSLSSLIIVVVMTFLFRFVDYSRTVFIIDWLILLFLASGVRVVMPILSEYFFSTLTKGRRILIFGAGNTGESLLREIKRDKNSKYHAVGFIDDDKQKIGKRIRGIPVLGTRENIPKLIKDNNVDELFIALSPVRKKEVSDIISICKKYNIAYRRTSSILDLKDENAIE